MISASLAILATNKQRNELAEFYNKSRRRLYSIAFSKLHDSTAAEDAAQETFLQIAAKGGVPKLSIIHSAFSIEANCFIMGGYIQTETTPAA